MTDQELVQQIRTKNPQYKSLPDSVLLNFALKQNPKLRSDVKTNINKDNRAKQAESLINEIQGQQSNTPEPEMKHPLRDFGVDVKDFTVGALKGAGRTITEMGGIIPAPQPELIGLSGKKGRNIISSAKQKLEATNEMQKYGGYAETVGELLLPARLITKATEIPRAISKAKGALELGTKELSKLSEGKFKKIFGFAKSELETKGGIIRNEAKKMPEKMTELATEFKDVLKSGNPTKNLKEAKKVGKEYWNKTLELVKNNNKSLNTNQIRSYLKQAVSDVTSFQSPFHEQQVLDKTVEPVMKLIKKGTLEGIEQARAKLSTISRGASGELKPAMAVLNTALKNIVKENLPEADKILYDAYKLKMARLFDVREILKAKNAIVSGTSLAKKVGKGVLAGGALVGVGSFVKSLFK